MLNVLGDATPFERRNRNKGGASFQVKLEKFRTDAFIVLLPRSETFSKSRDTGYRRIYFHSFRCPVQRNEVLCSANRRIDKQ